MLKKIPKSTIFAVLLVIIVAVVAFASSSLQKGSLKLMKFSPARQAPSTFERSRNVTLPPETFLTMSSFVFEVWYSLASPESFNEGIVFTGSLPANFNATTGYLYLNGKQINSDTMIRTSPLASERDKWIIGQNNTFIRYIISPMSLRTAFSDGVTSSSGISNPVMKVTVKFCDRRNVCSSKDYHNMIPSTISVGDF